MTINKFVTYTILSSVISFSIYSMGHIFIGANDIIKNVRKFETSDDIRYTADIYFENGGDGSITCIKHLNNNVRDCHLTYTLNSISGRNSDELGSGGGFFSQNLDVKYFGLLEEIYKTEQKDLASKSTKKEEEKNQQSSKQEIRVEFQFKKKHYLRNN